MATVDIGTDKVQAGPALPVHITNTSIPSSGGSTGVQTIEQKTYSTVLSGEIAGSATASQLPSIACKLVKFKAEVSNAGNVYIGVSGVTKPDGTTDTTTGLELLPGDDSGWMPIDNLSRLYRICDNAGDDLTYLALV